MVDPKIRSEVDISPEVELDIAANCNRGNHVLIIDEEIGTVCKYCQYVDVEIRYQTAPFEKRSSRYSERRDCYGEKNSFFDDLHDHDLSKHGCGWGTNMAGTVWSLLPGFGKGLHKHQREGFEFLWRNIGGGIHLDKLKDPTGYDGNSGCIISHAPGTGKTLLAIAFLQTYLKLYPSCRPVIIAPCSMMLSWEAEFKKWKVDIPFHNLSSLKLCGKENVTALKLAKSQQLSKMSSRMVKMYSWKNSSSVLCLSYSLFEQLVAEDKNKHKIGDERNGNKRREDGKKRGLSFEDYMRKALLELPGLIVLDEGHTPRNEDSLIFKALSKVGTDKRIILSGTPFQNNFDELFNILRLVRPKFVLGKEKAAKKKWASLTSAFGKDGNDRWQAEKLDELRAMINPVFHVHRGNILQQSLPGLRDAVVFLQPVQLQKSLLKKIEQSISHLPYFQFENLVSGVSVHPSLMCEKSFEAIGNYHYLKEYELDPDVGIKTKFLMELILLSEAMNEKVLVFSQLLEPLKLISKQLVSRFHWTEGTEILYMDGQVEAVQRQLLIRRFNDRKNEAKVLLASTRACSEGINLVGASRVVLLDVVWNPAVERQAISRAYRLGQEKVVYIYHLIAADTLEEDKYIRQAEKERLSELVFYTSNGGRERLPSDVSEDKKDKLLEDIVCRNNLKDVLKKIVYQPKDKLMEESFGLLNV